MKKQIIIIFILITHIAFGKDNSVLELFSIKAGYGYMLPDYNLKNIEGVASSCPGYNEHTGFSFNFGLGLSNPLFHYKAIYYFPSIQYNYINSEYLRNEFIGNADYFGEKQALFATHQLNLSFSYLFISNKFVYKNKKLAGIEPIVCFESGILSSAGFSQVEHINNENFTYIDDSEDRNKESGDIEQINKLQLFLNMGVQKEFKFSINNRYSLSLTPNITYNYDILGVFAEQKVKNNSVNIGLGIKFEVDSIPDTVQISTFYYDYTLLDANKTPINDKLEIINNKKEELYCIVPEIYFNKTASEINSYSLLNDFDDSKLFTRDILKDLDIENANLEILNIVGKYMGNNPNVKIDLEGYYIENESEGTNYQRMNTIKDYLVSIYHIEKSRIRFRNNQKANKSCLNCPKIIIKPSDVKMFAPVKPEREIENNFEHNTIRFNLKLYPETNKMPPNTKWSLEIAQSSQNYGYESKKIFSDYTVLPTYFDWNMEKDITGSINDTKHLDYRFNYIENGEIIESLMKIPISVKSISGTSYLYYLPVMITENENYSNLYSSYINDIEKDNNELEIYVAPANKSKIIKWLGENHINNYKLIESIPQINKNGNINGRLINSIFIIYKKI
jgi:hypothetical protein